MKFKLDENLGVICSALLKADGHDVMTVSEQALSGVSDTVLYDVCRLEMRVLVTLDHDFGHVLRFPPSATPGIVVLEIGGRMTAAVIAARMADFAALLRIRAIDRELWIVEPGRVRIHSKSGE